MLQRPIKRQLPSKSCCPAEPPPSQTHALQPRGNVPGSALPHDHVLPSKHNERAILLRIVQECQHRGWPQSRERGRHGAAPTPPCTHQLIPEPHPGSARAGGEEGGQSHGGTEPPSQGDAGAAAFCGAFLVLSLRAPKQTQPDQTGPFPRRRAGAELPWQALRTARHRLGKATQRLYQTFWLRWRLLFQPISARDMGRARPRRSLQQLHGDLYTLSQLTCGAWPWEITLSEPPQPRSLPPSQDAGDPQPTCLLSRSLTTLPTPERRTRD